LSPQNFHHGFLASSGLSSEMKMVQRAARIASSFGSLAGTGQMSM